MGSGRSAAVHCDRGPALRPVGSNRSRPDRARAGRLRASRATLGGDRPRTRGTLREVERACLHVRGAAARRDRPALRGRLPARSERGHRSGGRARTQRRSDRAVEREHDADELLRVVVETDLLHRTRPLIPAGERQRRHRRNSRAASADSAHRPARCPAVLRVLAVGTTRRSPTSPAGAASPRSRPRWRRRGAGSRIPSRRVPARASHRRGSAPTSGRARLGRPARGSGRPGPCPAGREAVDRERSPGELQAVIPGQLPGAHVVALGNREEALAATTACIGPGSSTPVARERGYVHRPTIPSGTSPYSAGTFAGRVGSSVKRPSTFPGAVRAGAAGTRARTHPSRRDRSTAPAPRAAVGPACRRRAEFSCPASRLAPGRGPVGTERGRRV